MSFSYKEIPSDIKPAETAYGRIWVLPQRKADTKGVSINEFILEIAKDKHTALGHEDTVHIEGTDGGYDLRRHENPPVWEEIVEVAEDSRGSILFVTRDMPTNTPVKEVHKPGEKFFSVERSGKGQSHTLYAPEGDVLLKVTATVIGGLKRP